MARRTKAELLSIITRSIAECGWNILYLSDPSIHPFRLQIYRDDASHRILIYIWNLTPGGNNRPSDEYRIQPTLSNQVFDLEPNGHTLILGCWESVEIFVGYDYRKHNGVLGKSSSFQIRELALRKAYSNGFATYEKGNGEIVIAFKPTFFMDYVKHLESLHDFGESPDDLNILDAVARNPNAVNDTQIEATDWTRKTVIQAVKKKLRDLSFQERVLTAYGYRCAMCGVQLDLVQAAHIIPVSHEEGTDQTFNGMALCTLHHYAYDRGLVFIDEEYSVEMNQNKVDKLRSMSRDDGLEEFADALRALIILPPTISDRPHIDYLRIANSLRLV